MLEEDNKTLKKNEKEYKLNLVNRETELTVSRKDAAETKIKYGS